MRAVSILLVLMHLYWFCYGFFLEGGWTLEIINKILGNFQRTTGQFSHTPYTKAFALVLLALSCLGTKGVKNQKITWTKIYVTLGIGFVLFFLNTPAEMYLLLYINQFRLVLCFLLKFQYISQSSEKLLFLGFQSFLFHFDLLHVARKRLPITLKYTQ